MTDPLQQRVFVAADGQLAERMCRVYLMNLTVERAKQLRQIHREHRPDDCLVHLAVAVFLLEADDS
ncbi:hypothetical protein ACQPXH_00435 [Nocardia sp. CA-135953]|uniref:hypothetical protein n=1 Tax=Nocardia sp. CA-135953 TaxID=3239978 RepID=UPI003D95746B